MSKQTLLALTAIAGFAAIPCQADTLSAPTGYINLQTNSTSSSYAVGSGQHMISDGSSTATGASNFASDPSVGGGVTARSLPSNPYSAIPEGPDAESAMFYQFEVVGPAGQLVPINFSSTGVASVSSTGTDPSMNATAYLNVSGLFTAVACAGAPSQVSDPCANQSGGAFETFNISQIFEVETDTAYTVNIYTSDSILQQATSLTGNFYADSSVDPTITLATTDPAYTLEFSPGVLGTAATPEPSSLLLVLTGLASVPAFTIRRRVPHP